VVLAKTRVLGVPYIFLLPITSIIDFYYNLHFRGR